MVNLEPGETGRFDDRLAQLRRGHRADRDLARPQGPGELRMGERAGVEVGPQAEYDHRRPAERAKRCDEGLPLGLVLAVRVRVLELIHDEGKAGWPDFPGQLHAPPGIRAQRCLGFCSGLGGEVLG